MLFVVIDARFPDIDTLWSIDHHDPTHTLVGIFITSVLLGSVMVGFAAVYRQGIGSDDSISMDSVDLFLTSSMSFSWVSSAYGLHLWSDTGRTKPSKPSMAGSGVRSDLAAGARSIGSLELRIVARQVSRLSRGLHPRPPGVRRSQASEDHRPIAPAHRRDAERISEMRSRWENRSFSHSSSAFNDR